MNHFAEQCVPGNYSQNGFEPCELCPQGEYQDKYESNGCIECPRGKTTGYIGTPDIEHCVSKGSYILITLLHTCVPYYESFEGEKFFNFVDFHVHEYFLLMVYSIANC